MNHKNNNAREFISFRQVSCVYLHKLNRGRAKNINRETKPHTQCRRKIETVGVARDERFEYIKIIIVPNSRPLVHYSLMCLQAPIELNNNNNNRITRNCKSHAICNVCVPNHGFNYY